MPGHCISSKELYGSSIELRNSDRLRASMNSKGRDYPIARRCLNTVVGPYRVIAFILQEPECAAVASMDHLVGGSKTKTPYCVNR